MYVAIHLQQQHIMYHQIPVAISLTSSPTSIVAGDDVTLSCSLSPPGEVSGTPFFQWEGPGVNESNIIRGRLYSQVLLNEITTSHAGFYNCSVSHSLGYMTTYIPVNVNSMYLYKHTVIVLLLFSLQLKHLHHLLVSVMLRW